MTAASAPTPTHGSWSDDARTAIAVAPEYFLAWYTIKSLALVAAFGALCYQLGKSSGRAATPGAPRTAGVHTGDAGDATSRTDRDVRVLDAMIQSYVDMMDNALLADAAAKYGPDAFAATVTAEQLPAFRDDRSFFWLWRHFVERWALAHQLVQGSAAFLSPADAYAQLASHLPGLHQWFDAARARRVDVDSTGLPEA